MSEEMALNAICPYYTMFPLSFPLSVLNRSAKPGQWVADPFCGRGTTNFAARLTGLPSVGVDSSPIAVALTRAKLSGCEPDAVVAAAKRILSDAPAPSDVPSGPFWEMAYHRDTLADICRVREALLSNCSHSPRVLLRAILLGALHGPLTKVQPSHLSNQCPRTFAPKPDYAVRFWKKRKLQPPKMDVVSVVKRRAHRYLAVRSKEVEGAVHLGDSRVSTIFKRHRFSWVITSPPYYGMRTYIPDQWIRYWFLGGPSTVEYAAPRLELSHNSSEEFVNGLAAVWRNVAEACAPGARLVARFGAINDRKRDPRDMMSASLSRGGWRLHTARAAGTAAHGRRQAIQFRVADSEPITEYDFYASVA